MGFREDVPLDGLLSAMPLMDLLTPARPGQAASGGTPSLDRAPPEPVLYPSPHRDGGGPLMCSTSLALEPWPSVVWDVNGYYHALGVGHKATRKQLKAAYQRLNGPNDVYLTYVLKQLLNPEVRRKYDAAPFGSRYLDKYVEEELKQRAQALAKRHARDPRDILEEWGFEVEREEDEPVHGHFSETPSEGGDPLDIPQEVREDGTTPDEEPEPSPWPYSYYLWNLRHRHWSLDFSGVMRSWQAAVAAECHRQGVTAAFAVGLTSEGGNGARFLTMSVAGSTVVFIVADHADDIDDIAPHAARRLTIRD